MRRIDLLVPLVVVVGLAVYLPHGFDGYLTRDLGLYAYAGQRVAEGVLPYVGVMNRAGPLAHLLPGLGVPLGDVTGLPDVIAMRVVFLGFAIACLVAAYLLARGVFHSRVAGLVAAAALLSLHGFHEYATHGPREKTPMVLFTYVALWAVARRRWASAGAFISLATLTWQPVFLLGIVAAVVGVLLLDPRRRVRGLIRIAVGGLVPLAVIVLCYLITGRLEYFLDGFVLANALNTVQTSFLLHPLEAWSGLVEGFGWTTAVLLLGVVAMLALGVRAVRRIRRSPGGVDGTDSADRVLVAIASGHLAGLLWSLLVFNGWGDAFFMMPTITLGLGGAVVVLTRPVSVRVARAGVAVLVVALVAATVQHTLTTDEDLLNDQRASTEAVFDHLPPNATLLSIEAPQPLVLRGMTNPSRHQMFLGGLDGYVDEHWPGGMDGYAAWILEEAPTMLSVQEPGQLPAVLRGPLSEHYRYVGDAPGWYWYVRDSVPDAVVEELRVATAEVAERVPASQS